MATRKQWFNDIQQQLNTDLIEKGFENYHSEDGEHFYTPFDCNIYIKMAINDKSIDISLAHTEEDLLNNHFFFLSLQVDNDYISFELNYKGHSESGSLGKYRRATPEQYINTVRYVSTEVVSAIINAPEVSGGI